MQSDFIYDCTSSFVHSCGFWVSRFTGKERDSESGLDNFGARYISSTMGRFMSPDPSGLSYANPFDPQSFNLYSYVRNNPLINTDPTGLDCVHINNDTGAYEGFESGDCDNSTEALANTGHYIDGTVNQISFNSQSQVIGYDASTSSGIFDTPGASNSGPAAFNLNPYANSLSTGQVVTVSGGSQDPLSLIPSSSSQSFLDQVVNRSDQLIGRIPSWVPCVLAPQTTMDTRDAINTVRGGMPAPPGPNTDAGSPGVPFMPNNNRSPKNGGRPKTGGQSAAARNIGDGAANAGAMGAQYAVAAVQCGQASR
jgi:RHS repeat-associated protein